MVKLPENITTRIQALLAQRKRAVLGLAGPPGCGKSTLAAQIETCIGSDAQVLPMDGFHLDNSVLDVLGRRDRKGAEDTFDIAGFVALVQRVAKQTGLESIYAPYFDRKIDAAIAGAISIRPSCRLVIIEGNYLLCNGQWRDARRYMSSVWYVDVEDAMRHKWLMARHMHYGRSRAEAEAWIAQTDAPNALYIKSFKSHADWIIPRGIIETFDQ